MVNPMPVANLGVLSELFQVGIVGLLAAVGAVAVAVVAAVVAAGQAALLFPIKGLGIARKIRNGNLKIEKLKKLMRYRELGPVFPGLAALAVARGKTHLKAPGVKTHRLYLLHL